jgi:hypothetical protein
VADFFFSMLANTTSLIENFVNRPREKIQRVPRCVSPVQKLHGSNIANVVLSFRAITVKDVLNCKTCVNATQHLCRQYCCHVDRSISKTYFIDLQGLCQLDCTLVANGVAFQVKRVQRCVDLQGVRQRSCAIVANRVTIQIDHCQRLIDRVGIKVECCNDVLTCKAFANSAAPLSPILFPRRQIIPTHLNIHSSGAEGRREKSTDCRLSLETKWPTSITSIASLQCLTIKTDITCTTLLLWLRRAENNSSSRLLL